jgi:hypothetical protein
MGLMHLPAGVPQDRPRPRSRVALLAKWRATADALRAIDAHVSGGALCEQFIADLNAVEADSPDESLTLAEAAAESGYSPAHLRRLASRGVIQASGRGRHWRIARRSLPVKPSRVAAPATRVQVLGAKAEQVVRASAGVSHGTPR